jgi:hypothetical protein
MKRIQKHFKEYLTLTGHLKKKAHLGPGEEIIIEVKAEHNKLLEGLLHKQIKSNKKAVVFTIIFLLIITAGIILFLVFFIDDRNALLPIIGSIGALIALILTQLQRLRKYWRENAIMEATGKIIDDLPKEEAAKVILSLYLNSLSDGEK